MRIKYQLRTQLLNGIQTDFDWITDSEIEELLAQKNQSKITLLEAADLYYRAAIHEDLTLDHKILGLGLVRYVTDVLHLGIDIFPELVGKPSLIS